MYIKLDEDLKVPKGNFGFVYDKTNEKELFDRLLACESVYRLNYEDFAHKLRKAFESIAIWFEIKYLRRNGLAEGKSDAELKKIITKNVMDSGYTINIGDQRDQYYTFKNILVRYTYDFPEKFEKMLEEFGFNSRKDIRDNLAFYIRYIYDFGSRSSHAGEKEKPRFIPNQRNARRVLYSFHDFLCILFSSNHVFSEKSIPIGEFYPVPDSVCRAQGLTLSDRESLYVREEYGKVKYYLGIMENAGLSLKDKREMETIRRLWEESYDTPSNIIRTADLIQGADAGERYQFYSVSDFPVSLNQAVIRKMSEEERRRLVQGIGKGVYSLHCCDPPIYHRNLCPEVFLLFQVQNHYKILLADFRYTKSSEQFSGSGEDSEETVFFDLSRMASCRFNNDYFAPEVRGFTGDRNTLDWEKADVFSLGQLWLYIMTGDVIEAPEDTYRVINRAQIGIREKDILADMLSWDADDRPGMKEVMRVMCFE
ncbi:MAG: hypothetical protein SO101_09350 [Lachnospiraceae bacterium]|nr:hypothetical protein [Lachnospiraceae bacterium]